MTRIFIGISHTNMIKKVASLGSAKQKIIVIYEKVFTNNK